MTSEQATQFRQRYAEIMKSLKEAVAPEIAQAETLFTLWVLQGMAANEAGEVGEKILYSCAVAGLMTVMISVMDKQKAERN